MPRLKKNERGRHGAILCILTLEVNKFRQSNSLELMFVGSRSRFGREVALDSNPEKQTKKLRAIFEN